MKYIKTGFLFLLLISLESCKEPEVETQCVLVDLPSPVTVNCKLTKDLDTAKLYISGTWNWLQDEYISRGNPVEYRNPKNQGYSKTLELSSETAKFYKCGQLEGTYKFSVIRLKEISMTNFPEDEDPVLVIYDMSTGVRKWHVPLKICDDYLVLQYQLVRSIGGEAIWKRK